MSTNGNTKNEETFKNLDYRNIKNKFVVTTRSLHLKVCSYRNQMNRVVIDEKMSKYLSENYISIHSKTIL